MYIPDKDANGNIIQTLQSFTSKSLPNGKKLFKRVHGSQASVLPGQTIEINLIVPYNESKINEIDVVGGNTGDTCNFKVYDTITGTISGIPGYMLNQFGFNVNVSKDFYKQESSYDADLIKDMKLQVQYTNNSLASTTIGINFILHEVK